MPFMRRRSSSDRSAFKLFLLLESEVIYVVDDLANFARDVGIRTRFRRRWQFSAFALSCRAGSVRRPVSPGASSRLATDYQSRSQLAYQKSWKLNFILLLETNF